MHEEVGKIIDLVSFGTFELGSLIAKPLLEVFSKSSGSFAALCGGELCWPWCTRSERRSDLFKDLRGRGGKSRRHAISTETTV